MKSPQFTLKTCLQIGIAAHLLTLPLASAAITFQGLGIPAGYTESYVAAISGDGKVAVGTNFGASSPRPFKWSAGTGMQDFGAASGVTSAGAQDVNSDGTVIVGEAVLSNKEICYRWTASGGFEDLGNLPGERAGAPSATAVSADGNTIVGYVYKDIVDTAFRWTKSSGIHPLGALAPYSPCVPYGISANGKVVVGRAEDSNKVTQPFRWQAAVFPQAPMKALGLLPSTLEDQGAYANATNSDGTVVVGASTSGDGYEAFRWIARGSKGILQSIGDLPLGGINGEARSVSADGSVVVGYGDENGVTVTAAIWTSKTGMQSLKTLLATAGVSVAGWELESAEDISYDGKVIVGTGTHAGKTESWILTGADELLQFAKVQGVQVEQAQALEKSARLAGTADVGTASVQIRTGHRVTKVPVINDSRTARGRWVADVPVTTGDNLVEVSSATPARDERPTRLHVVID